MNDERKMGLHPIPNDPRRGVRSERRTQSDLLTQQRLVDIMRPTQGSPYGPNLTQSLPDGGGEAPIAGLGFGEVGDEYIVDTPKQEYRYPAKNYGVSDVEYDGRQKDLITGGEMSNAQQPPFDTLPDRDFGRRFQDFSFGSIPKWRHNNFALDIDKTRHPQAWRAMDWQLQQMMQAPGKGNLPMTSIWAPCIPVFWIRGLRRGWNALLEIPATTLSTANNSKTRCLWTTPETLTRKNGMPL